MSLQPKLPMMEHHGENIRLIMAKWTFSLATGKGLENMKSQRDKRAVEIVLLPWQRLLGLQVKVAAGGVSNDITQTNRYLGKRMRNTAPHKVLGLLLITAFCPSNAG